MSFTKEEIAIKACDILEEIYPDSACALKYEKPYELLIAVRLSAQCTDARVNIVTKTLFQKYTTLEAFANAELSELEQDIKPCGFYRTKAESIIGMAQRLISVYDSRIPDTMEELLTLPGVGRKTANLILGDVYGKPAIVTDTHFIRITGRLGLTKNKEPFKVEKDLRPLIPPERSSDFCHRIVQFGRDTCSARKPKCTECKMQNICVYFQDNFKQAQNWLTKYKLYDIL